MNNKNNNNNYNNNYTHNVLADKRPMAEDLWVSNDDIKSGYNNNDLIIGGSGCGKTTGYVIPNIKSATGNLIITDTKGQLHKLLSDDLRDKHYNVKVLDFAHPEKSIRYNPLDYIACKIINGEMTYSEKDIVSLSRALLPTRNAKDAFWEETARTVLTFLIAFDLEALIDKDHHMAAIAELYRTLNKPAGLDKFQNWCDKNPESFAARKLPMFANLTKVDRTWECVAQFVAEALEPFDYKEMRTIFGKKESGTETLHISDLWKEKTAIFMIVSDTDRYADSLANLFYTQVFQILCDKADNLEDGRLPYPVRFILDDFASNVYIEGFDKIISVIRSRNISVSVIIQSLTQLETMYSKAHSETIITNCDHVLYMGGQDIATARYVGYRSGKTEDNILLMPLRKAYFIERGKKGEMVDIIRPQISLRFDEEFYDEFELIDYDDEDVPFK